MKKNSKVEGKGMVLKTVILPENTWRQLIRTLNKCADKDERGYGGFQSSSIYWNFADKIKKQLGK